MTLQKKLGVVAAFEQYQAKLTNYRWAVSAIAADGSLVISCWETYFRTVNRTLKYEDALSRWDASNSAGSNLLKSHLEQAQRDGLKVRLVVAHWSEGANRVADYFHVRPDVVGRVAEFDGDRFVLEFRKAAA